MSLGPMGIGLGLVIGRGRVGAAVTLARTYRGLLAHRIANDATVPMATAEWSAGLHTSKSLASGRLRIAVSSVQSGFSGATFLPSPSRDRRFTQAKLRCANQGWMGVCSAASDGRNWSGLINSVLRDPESTRVASITSGSPTYHSTSDHGTAKAADTDYVLQTWHDGTTRHGYDFASDVSLGPATASHASGQVAVATSLGTGNAVEVSEVYDMADWLVTVTGLGTGQVARVRQSDGTVLASATESGGTAEIDLTGVDVTLADEVAVFESDGTTLVVTGAPDDGIVAGGDIWDVTPGEFIPTDGVWSWFADPRAVRYQGTNDRTYWGAVDSGGNIVVHSFDHDTGVLERGLLSTAFEIDDHDVPVLRVCSDGKLQAFYSKHDGSTMRHRTTTNAEDITEWDAEQTYGSATTFTYPSPADVPGKVILHWRQGNVSPQAPYYGESTDDGASFGTSQQMISDHSPYHKFAVHPTNTDRIDYVVSNNHPESGATSLYHLYRDGDDWFDSEGTDIGDPPFALSEATTLWDAATEGESGWQWDITHDPATGNPVILFVRFPSTTDHRLMYAKWNGTSWDINEVAALGGTIATGGDDPNYSAGAAIDPTNVNRVWLAIESSSGAVASIWEYITSDGGATWGTKTERTPGTSTLNARPFVPRGGRHDDVAVLFFRGTYVGYTDYDTVVDALGVS